MRRSGLTVGLPTLHRIGAGERAQSTLDGWKGWLQANNATVMSVLMLVLGVVVAGNSIAELST